MPLTLPHQRISAGLAGAALIATSLVAAATTPSTAAPSPDRAAPRQPASQVVLDWERIIFRTVYAEGGTPIPVGVPLMGYASMAMYDAARTSLDRRRSSEAAAVAVAAHGVLSHHFATNAALGPNLLASLAAEPDGAAKDRGIRIGEAAARRLLASRAGDGYGDPDVHYTKPPGVGVWQPSPPATDMLAAWIASMDPLVLPRLVRVDGPDPLDSPEYAADYREVKRLGSATSSARTTAQTLTALFYNSNSATMVGDALVRRLQERPMGLRRTARIFAAMHASMTDTLIRCWQLKRDVGLWRPSQAIAGAADDGNPATRPEAGWTPLVPNPPYSEYVSGHACLTAPAIETIRQLMGERTTLELVSVYAPRSRVYRNLGTIERQALTARIWSGLHFRDAMEDGYTLGHRTARRVLRLLG